MWKFVCAAVFALAFAAGQQTFLTAEKSAETGNILKNGSSFYQVGTGGLESLIFINASYDLKSWQSFPVINETNKPRWAILSSIQNPEINLLKDKPRIYFAAKSASSNKLAISVAFTEFLSTPSSDQPLWPTLSAPLLLNETQGVAEPTISASFEGSFPAIVLFYSGIKDKKLYAARLAQDGLIIREFMGTVLDATHDWENGQLSKAHLVQKGDFHYLFYVGNSPCSPETAIGVARSRSVFGPYEKLGEPVITAKHFEDSGAICNLHPRDIVHKLPSWESGAWPRLF